MPHPWKTSGFTWGSEEPDLVEDALLITGGLDWMTFKGPCQPRLLFDFIILRKSTIFQPRLAHWTTTSAKCLCRTLPKIMAPASPIPTSGLQNTNK